MKRSPVNLTKDQRKLFMREAMAVTIADPWWRREVATITRAYDEALTQVECERDVYWRALAAAKGRCGCKGIADAIEIVIEPELDDWDEDWKYGDDWYT